MFSINLSDWLTSLYGWLIYVIVMWRYAKSIDDKAGLRFNFRKYAYVRCDEWIVGFILTPALVAYMDDIVNLVTQLVCYLRGIKGCKPHMYSIYYLGDGILTELLYIGLAKLSGLKDKYIGDKGDKHEVKNEDQV